MSSVGSCEKLGSEKNSWEKEGFAKWIVCTSLLKTGEMRENRKLSVLT